MTLLLLNKTRSSVDFIISRFSRLYPAYWTALIFSYMFVWFFAPSEMILPSSPSLSDFFFNFTLLQGWFNVQYVVGAHWTLSLEITFYAIMFLLLITGTIKKHIDLFCMMWLLIEVIAKYLEVNGVSLNAIANNHLLLNFAHVFIVGMMFYQMWSRGQSLLRYLIIGGCIATQLFIFDTSLDKIVGGVYIHHGSDAPILCGLALLFTLFINNKLTFIINKPLVFLGTISYCLYLIHEYIGYVVIYVLETHYRLHSLFAILTAITLSVSLAILMTFYIELPALRFIRNQKRKVFPNLFNKIVSYTTS